MGRIPVPGGIPSQFVQIPRELRQAGYMVPESSDCAEEAAQLVDIGRNFPLLDGFPRYDWADAAVREVGAQDLD